MFGGDGGARGGECHRQLRGLVAAFHFVDQHQLFVLLVFDGEGRAAAGAQQRVAVGGGEFDVLRIMIVAAMMITSFKRPVTNSSPSLTKPRSPVRMNGPSPLASRASKVCADSAGRFQ